MESGKVPFQINFSILNAQEVETVNDSVKGEAKLNTSDCEAIKIVRAPGANTSIVY